MHFNRIFFKFIFFPFIGLWMFLKYYWEYVGSLQFLNLSASVLWTALLHTADSQRRRNIFYSPQEIFYSLQ